jgi:hypothetical protein
MHTPVHCVLFVMFACNTSFVDLLMFHFDGFWGMCGENSCNGFLMLLMVLLVLVIATLCKRAMLILWHAFVFPELRHMGFPLLSPLLLTGGFHYFLCNRKFPFTLAQIKSSIQSMRTTNYMRTYETH